MAHVTGNSERDIGAMSRIPSNRSGQSFIEYALIIILLAIVMLSILLILGDDLRTFINDLLQTWFPSQTSGIYLNVLLD